MVAVVVAFAFAAAAAALVAARPYYPCRNSNENSANPTQYTLGTTPSTPLPWNDWNFIASTDTHGWQAGHGTDDDGQYSADWADFAVFVAKMRKKAQELGKELFVVDSGDTHDGTSLSDGTSLDGKFTQPMMELVDYDVLTIGNHELYKSDVTKSVHDDFSPFWGIKYLTSNVYYVDPITYSTHPIGQKYRFFTGSMGTRVLSYGFLFNFTMNSNASVVKTIQHEITQPWFTESLVNHEVDLLLLTGHDGIRGSDGKLAQDWSDLVSAIRVHKPTTPIVIFGGHTHIRDFVLGGPNVYAMESGRYMETVGFVSLSRNGSNINRRYLDANKPTFNYHLGLPADNDIGSNEEVGKEIRALIAQAETFTNYTVILGTAPQNYYLNRVPATDPSSLYYLLTQKLAKLFQLPDSNPIFFVMNSGSQRTDIFKGPFTENDATSVSPFTNKLKVIRNIPYSSISQFPAALESLGFSRRDDSMPAQCAGLTYGYVTIDYLSPTLGNGDDTLHCPIPVYTNIPNNIYSPPISSDTELTKLFDIVFVDFIEKKVVTALNRVVADKVFAVGQAQLYGSFNSQDVWSMFAARYWN